MNWEDYIKELKQKWIGQIVLYSSWFYTVVGVDANGALLIDLPTQFNETTAVSESDVQTVEKRFVEFGKKWTIDSIDDLAFALAVLRGSEFVANMSDSYAATCAEVDEVRKQRKEVFQQAIDKGIIDKRSGM